MCVCVYFVVFYRRWRVGTQRSNGGSVPVLCLRARSTRYVAAAALWLLAACGCCLAVLLLLSTLLGVIAAVLLPSVLRCAQLGHWLCLLQPEMFMLEFVQRLPYYCIGFENSVDIAAPWLRVKQMLLRQWIGLLFCCYNFITFCC